MYEAPAPVGEKESYVKSNDNSEGQQEAKEGAVKFPHIYCGLNAECIVSRYKITRDVSDGTFLNIEGL